MIAEIARLLDPLRRRVQGMVLRAVVTAVRDSLKMQGVQVSLRHGEVRDDVEHWQPYGFTSTPHEGAEAIVVHVGGEAEHPAAIVIDDRRYRIKSRAAGEVTLYDDQDQTITLYRDRIEIETTQPVVIDSPDINLGESGLGASDGVVHGSGIDPFTGTAYYLLGNASTIVKAERT